MQFPNRRESFTGKHEFNLQRMVAVAIGLLGIVFASSCGSIATMSTALPSLPPPYASDSVPVCIQINTGTGPVSIVNYMHGITQEPGVAFKPTDSQETLMEVMLIHGELDQSGKCEHYSWKDLTALVNPDKVQVGARSRVCAFRASVPESDFKTAKYGCKTILRPTLP